MLTKIDLWLGKKLFIPIIIWICQRAKITQYKFNIYAWVIATFSVIYSSELKNATDWVVLVLMSICALFWILQAALIPDMPRNPTGLWFRFFIMTCIVLFDIIPTIAGTPIRNNIIFGPLVLFAEYALTIKTIPPLEAKEKAPSEKLVEAKANSK